MSRWNIIFDVDLCTGCRSCVMAVKDEYVGNYFPGYSAEMPRHGADWVGIRMHERGRYPAVDVAYLYQSCQHCDDAPCLAAAKNGAVKKRADGIVQFDPVLAKGQKQLVEACPFKAVHWNEALELPQQWNMDAHLLDSGWPAPRPVQSCATGALCAIKVDDAEMRRIAEREGLEPLEPGSKHKTRVHYKNLYRCTKAFVAGTLAANRGTLEACVPRASVRLLRGAEKLAECASDAFGDFRFDRLAPASGAYRVEVLAQGYRAKTLDFELTDSRWLGEIRLEGI